MGLHYEEQQRKETQSRPVIILRNVCELCGHSFDNQFVFFKHLKEHYEPEFVPIGYPEAIPIPEEDIHSEDNDGFVNDNEQFEEIFNNNINKSPDMIEHLEIFIKNQESRTETIDGMMMIEDARAVTEEAQGGSGHVPQFGENNVEAMREEQENNHTNDSHLIGNPEQAVAKDSSPHDVEVIIEQSSQAHPIAYQEPLVHQNIPSSPVQIRTDDIEEEIIKKEEENHETITREEHFAEISSIPSSPQQPQSLETTIDQQSTSKLKVTEKQTKIPLKKSKNKKHPCQQCDRIFDSSTALKYHLTTHEDRKVKCEYCDKLFLTKATLNIHIRIHLEKRPYNCSQCEMQFRQKTDLNYHISSKHTAIEDYRFTCEYCNKKFARKYSLNLHTKLHTGVKNHQCQVCSKSFRASSYLQVHLRTHTGEKPYECGMCAKKFTVKADVRRHIAQVHQSKKDKGGSNGNAGEGTSSSSAIKRDKREKIKLITFCD